MKLQIIEGTFAVLQYPPGTPLPNWVIDKLQTSDFLSISSTKEELSIVCSSYPSDGEEKKIEGDYSCMKIEGPLDFSLIGILSSLSSILANVGISIFAVSTYNTDYILVKKLNLDKAVEALSQQGHVVN